MEAQFWKTRWDDNQIGFHQNSTNPMLLSHWHKTSLKPGDRVLVPLCGKSLDMLFLKSLGLEVVGIELVEKACLEFFSDNNLAYSAHTIPSDHNGHGALVGCLAARPRVLGLPSSCCWLLLGGRQRLDQVPTPAGAHLRGQLVLAQTGHSTTF